MLKIKTETLKTAVTKSVKGSSRLPMLLLTNCIGIEVKDGNLILTTTDGSTNLEVTVKVNTNEEFYACTDSALFASLVSKTTTDDIGLEIRNESLFFRGNGVYNLPLVQDEEGNTVRIPVDTNFDAETAVTVKKEDIVPLYKFNKLAVAKTKEIPQFSAYCVSHNRIYTYNTTNLCISKSKLGSFNMLLPASVADLLALIDEDEIQVVNTDSKFIIKSNTIFIQGTVVDGFEKFPIDAANQLITPSNFSTKIELNTTQLVNVLDRMSLFIAPEDMNAINLTLTEDYLTITNRAGNGCEKLLYLSRPTGNPSLETCLDISDLKMVVSAVELDSVNIAFSDTGNACIELTNSYIVIPSISTEEEEQVEEEYVSEEDEVEDAE